MKSTMMISRLLLPSLGSAASFGLATLLAACSSAPAGPSTGGAGGGGTTTSATSGTGGTATCAKEPASGFSTVVAPSTDGSLGYETSMVADEAGDPMIAYEWLSPGGSGDATSVYFTRWDRCVGAFTAPVKVDVVGGVSTGNPVHTLALAYDAATKQMAIAYELVFKAPGFENNPTNAIYLQTSADKGATWVGKIQISEAKGGDIDQSRGPAVAISGGKIQIAYQQDNHMCCPNGSMDCPGCAAIWYVEGDGKTFTREPVKDANDIVWPWNAVVSMAVDSAGKPALAFFGAPATGYNATAFYWRPGSAAVKVMDSNNIQNDEPSLSLAFDGTKPRIVAHLVADESANYDMRFAASDDGVTWKAPVQLPRDGSQGSAWYQSLAIDAKGDAAVSANVNSGSGDNTCGGPLIVRSNDLTTWSACGADKDKKYPDIGGRYVQSYFLPSGKLLQSFTGTLGGDQSGNGVVLWREP